MEAKKQTEEKPLRQGYTTGACATAVTKAALTALITGIPQTEATIYLPIKKFATFQMESCEWLDGSVKTSTIKDAGDDPDATHGALIEATVSFQPEGVTLDGGVGVGRVTKPGLPVSVGEAAINPVPRKMILQVVEDVLTEYGVKTGVRVIISVPKGEEMAEKTLNGRLGIIGGISILGTRGTVVPFSTSAYMASIVQAISVARASNCEHVVITTGGRSEKYAMKQYPHLPEEAFIEMGDFVGFTLKQCKKQGVKKVSMVGMMGKFSKVAQGVMMVHSKSAPVSLAFLSEVAAQSGASDSLVEEIKEANTASQAAEIMAGNESFFTRLCTYCNQSALTEVKGDLTIETTLYTMKGEQLGKAMVESGD